MELSRDAESHYKELLGIKVSEIEEVCQPELRHAKESMPRSGARGKAIANALLKRWRMLGEAKMECWLTAYRKYNITLERSDAVEFAKEKFDGARQSILNSFLAHAGGAASNHFINEFERINRVTRMKLLAAVTDLALERQEVKRRKREEKRMRKKQGNMRVNIEGDAIGSAFQTGKKSKAKLSTTVTVQLNQTVQQLRQEFEKTEELEPVDKTEGLKQIDKLKVALAKQQTPNRMEKIRRRVGLIIGYAATTEQLIKTVSPLVEHIKQLLPHIKW